MLVVVVARRELPPTILLLDILSTTPAKYHMHGLRHEKNTTQSSKGNGEEFVAMTDEFRKQDGGPVTQPDAEQNVSDPNHARPAAVGERSTEEGVAGQGLGQMPDGESERKDSDSKQ